MIGADAGGEATMRGRMGSCLALALALSFASFAALAQQGYVDIEQRLTAEQLHEVALTPAQLLLLNRMLREQTAQASDTARPSANAERDPSRLIGFNDVSIKSRLVGTVSGWEPGTVFELENGQQWKVLKGRITLPRPVQAPDIEIIAGVAGRWFLQIDEDMPKARVYRID